MRYLDVCSGISAPTQAWADLGFTCAGYAEIEPFPRAVLQERFGAVAVDWDHRHTPGSNVTPLFGDFTKIESHHVGPVDLLVGGTPCQAFSVAGKRLGLDDPRGNLTLEFLALARRLRVQWVVWENVPGFLSHDEGRTMGTFLRLLGECGFGWAYRVLDAQFIRVDGLPWAVPQRRRRLFVVGHIGDSAGPAAILFERESLRGDSAPRRETGKGTAPTLSARTKGGGGLGTDFDCDGGLIAGTIGASTGDWSRDNIGESVVAIQERAVAENPESGPQGVGIRTDGVAYTLEARNVPQAVAFSENQQGHVFESDTVQALNRGGGKPGQGYAAIREGCSVRRLTPRECERLMGFADDFTLITYRGKPAADGPRYKALGNSQARNQMRWIGRGLLEVATALRDRKEAA